MIKAAYEVFACLFMKYSDEILVNPPGNATLLQCHSNQIAPKKRCPREAGYPHCQPLPAFFFTLPQALGMGHCWKLETEAAQPGSFGNTCHESWLEHEKAIIAADT